MTDIVNQSKVWMARFKDITTGTFFIVNEPDKKTRLYMKVDPVSDPIHLGVVKYNLINVSNGYYGKIADDDLVTAVDPVITF